jgi:hypothetical protein
MEPPALLLSEATDWRRRSIIDECVDPGGTVPGGYMPSFFQRTRITHGSAGRVYWELESTLRNCMLPGDLPEEEAKLPSPSLELC